MQEDILPSTGRLSHYEVQRQIGSGRFSTVFRAKAIKDNGRLVAMKKIQVPYRAVRLHCAAVTIPHDSSRSRHSSRAIHALYGAAIQPS